MIHALFDGVLGIAALFTLTIYTVIAGVTTMQLRDRFIFAQCTRWGCDRCGIVGQSCRKGCSHPCDLVVGGRILAGIAWPVTLPMLGAAKIGTMYFGKTIDVSQRVSGRMDAFRGPDQMPQVIAIERRRDAMIAEVNEKYARGALPEGERDRKVIEILHLGEGDLK